MQMAVSGYSSTPKCPGGDPPRAVAGPPLVAFLLAAGAAVLLLGCAKAGHVDRASSSLVAGVRARPMPRAQLAPAAAPGISVDILMAGGSSIRLPRGR